MVLNNLYEHTTMRSAFHINTLALVNGAPQVLSLKQIIFHYIQFRREIITNRTRFELRRAQDRAHVLEGLRTALDDLDPVIAVIRNAESADAARITLIERWTLSQRQAQAILDTELAAQRTAWDGTSRGSPARPTLNQHVGKPGQPSAGRFALQVCPTWRERHLVQ